MKWPMCGGAPRMEGIGEGKEEEEEEEEEEVPSRVGNVSGVALFLNARMVRLNSLEREQIRIQ